MTERLQSYLRAAKTNKFFTRALPFGLFVVGGSFYLKQFSTLRYEFRKGKRLTPEEAAAMGIDMKDVKVVQNDILKKIETGEVEDDWQNIRGPRPWEDSKTIQDEQRQEISQKNT